MPSSPRSPPTRREGSYANLARADAGEQMISTGGRIVRAKRYGGRFGNGFLDFLKTSELADCTVSPYVGDLSLMWARGARGTASVTRRFPGVP